MRQLPQRGVVLGVVRLQRHRHPKRVLSLAQLGAQTPNMKPISVTLEVSKLSGWLNTDATCRVTCRWSKGRHAVRRREAAPSRVQERARLRFWGRQPEYVQGRILPVAS